jgi:hypothetical protein
MALRHLEDRRAVEVHGLQIGVARDRRGEHAAEMVVAALADDERGAVGEQAAHAAGMVHVVMGQHHPADGLAREPLLRGLHHPGRLRVGDRRIDDDEVIAHLDEQAVVRAAGDVERARRDLLQAQTLRALGVVAHVVRIHVGADELAAEHPLVGHVAGGRLGRVRQHRSRNRQARLVDRLVEAHAGELGFLHHAPVELVFAAHRHLDLVDLLPLRVDVVVRDVAPDVVVVERAHALRKPGLRVEGDDQALVGHRREAAPLDHDIRRRLDRFGVRLHGRDEAARRAAHPLAQRGGEPVARHRVRRRIGLHAFGVAAVAVDADHVARVGLDDLAIGEGARRGVGEVLRVVVAAGARGAVDDGVELGLRGEAGLAARHVGLLGLPEFHRAAARGGLDRRERLGAPHGVRGLVDQALFLRRGGAGKQKTCAG